MECCLGLLGTDTGLVRTRVSPDSDWIFRAAPRALNQYRNPSERAEAGVKAAQGDVRPRANITPQIQEMMLWRSYLKKGTDQYAQVESFETGIGLFYAWALYFFDTAWVAALNAALLSPGNAVFAAAYSAGKCSLMNSAYLVAGFLSDALIA